MLFADAQSIIIIKSVFRLFPFHLPPSRSHWPHPLFPSPQKYLAGTSIGVFRDLDYYYSLLLLLLQLLESVSILVLISLFYSFLSYLSVRTWGLGWQV